MGVGCIIGMSVSPNLTLAEGRSGAIPLAFQLYTVRGEFSRDVPGTLGTLGEIGYRGVEFWGYGGTPSVYQNYSAQQLREILDKNCLKCCGFHVELKALAAENIERTVENSGILGNEYLNVAAAEEKMATEKSIGELADQLNKAAVKCRRHKLVVGYHAHPFDFSRINGRFAWEHLFRQTHPEVNMQMDVGNCLAGEGDPIAMLKEFPGRTRTIHIKEHKEKTFDSSFYQEVFRLCETTGTRWYIVEMGSAEGDGFEIPRAALAKLHRLKI